MNEQNVKPMTIESVLTDWDGDYVELTLITGQKMSGGISMAYDGQTVIVGIDTDEETLYRTSAVVGARWLADGDGPAPVITDLDRVELTNLVHAARKAAEGDSNDTEIEALDAALDEALRQLGREDLR